MGHLLGISGLKQSGKSTCADILANEKGYSIVPFAGALKVAVSELFGWTLDQLESGEFKEAPLDKPIQWSSQWHTKLMDAIKRDWPYRGEAAVLISPRRILQYVGMDIIRQREVNFHINRVKEVVESNYDLDFVIPDVRFENEVDMIHSIGGRVIYIDNGGSTDDMHPSEQDVLKNKDKCDSVIENSGTIEELKIKLFKELEKYAAEEQ